MIDTRTGLICLPHIRVQKRSTTCRRCFSSFFNRYSNCCENSTRNKYTYVGCLSVPLVQPILKGSTIVKNNMVCIGVKSWAIDDKIKALKVRKDDACGMLVVVVCVWGGRSIIASFQNRHCYPILTVWLFHGPDFVMHGCYKQENRWKRWMLPKCVLFINVRTCNQTPLVHQDINSH